MNIVFIGASKFGLRVLETILSIKNVHIIGAITAPEKFKISYNKEGVINILHADITAMCRGNKIPVVEMLNGMKDDALFKQVASWNPDIFLVSGWYHMIPKSWRDLAPAYGLHASLLPDYSGGAPLVWAMINGETETGITFFQFDEGVDSGPIVAQKKVSIYEDDTIATLYARIEDAGIGLLRDHLPALICGRAMLQRQDESGRRIFSQRSPSDGRIDWSKSARDIHNFIRAQTKPYPGAFSIMNGKKVSIWSSTIGGDNCNLRLGEVYLSAGNIVVGCGYESSIQIHAASVDDEDVDLCAFHGCVFED